MIQPDISVFPSGNTIGSIGSTRCEQTSNSIIRTEKFDLTTSQVVIIIFLLFTMMKPSCIYLLGKLVLQSSYLMQRNSSSQFAPSLYSQKHVLSFLSCLSYLTGYLSSFSLPGISSLRRHIRHFSESSF